MRRSIFLLVTFVLALMASPLHAKTPTHHVKSHRAVHHVVHRDAARHHAVRSHAHPRRRPHTRHRVAELPPIPIDEFALELNGLDGHPLPPPALNAQEVHCMTKAVYLESRGESDKGKAAVAYIVLNRMKSSRYPDSACGVVRQSVVVKGKRYCQFSWECTGHTAKLSGPAWERCVKIARAAMLHRIPNPIGDALSFHVRTLKLHWHGYPIVIGHHVFFSPTPYLAQNS